MYESNAHEILSKCCSKKVFILTSADPLLDYYRVCLKLNDSALHGDEREEKTLDVRRVN